MIVASRTNMSALASQPEENHSAIPSAYHRGMRKNGLRAVAACEEPNAMSNMKTWTSSWRMTWTKSSCEPLYGSTMRLRYGSLNPPVPSPIRSSATLVCAKSLCEAYRMNGTRRASSWSSRSAYSR